MKNVLKKIVFFLITAVLFIGCSDIATNPASVDIEKKEYNAVFYEICQYDIQNAKNGKKIRIENASNGELFSEYSLIKIYPDIQQGEDYTSHYSYYLPASSQDARVIYVIDTLSYQIPVEIEVLRFYPLYGLPIVKNVLDSMVLSVHADDDYFQYYRTGIN